uniref:TLC domain-containing protein n=1 Tax=Palpitomonas bilix TaxID=652834 RepID=A0A7S3D694_9EUKA|mmetsp:Transcript_2407/g.4997  ORF Transcript_2407/g.4997 Transcript_2407/m.4997 type:complete len:308 (+) Transcript_2407:178-1101(+)|eukprot:CAMPEP_0113867394 /NCGR_PEP_ID=MMETSP0780_2-20120614/394_1 /TAXON_ID=652834 /ORGANISM="Palpitomonas bilix" /LENGTH=307 /DNA_ID=CAMNT_0000852331 /DNA_START=49 /DNA_END=972 /DNA_ORIENTATION=- /assembly_acc=CAM_ASM_000599
MDFVLEEARSVIDTLGRAAESFSLNNEKFVNVGLVEKGIHDGREVTTIAPYTLAKYIAASALVFIVILFVQFPISYLFSSTFRKLKFNEKVSWASYVISLCHAPTSALFACLCVYEGYLQGVSEKLFTFTTDLQVMVLSWTLGYMIVDQIVILLFASAFKDFTALVIHHIVILGSYSLGLLNSPEAYGGMIMVSYQVQELANPFLTMRWFFEKVGMKNSLPYVLDGVMLVLVWGIVRIGFGSFVCYFLVTEFPDEAWRTPPLVVSLSLGVIFQVLQFYWGYKIFKGLLRAIQAMSDSGKQNQKSKED